MQIGLVYPQIEYPTDLGAVRDYAQHAEGLGFSHILAYDHVLGANPERPGGWQGPYTYQNPFHEPFVLFSFMAAAAPRLGFATGILILPQRQTALVAKQAASLDVLCGGKLRLGVGIGWNAVEYAALGQDFHTRGRRSEEQVGLLRRLWTEPLVNFSGRWEQIPDAGLNPLPIQRPIPIWIGGKADAALRRAARYADGWLPMERSPDTARPALDLIHKELAAAGRSPESFGIEFRLNYSAGGPDTWHSLLESWQSAGAGHCSFNTMGCDFRSVAEHLRAVEEFAGVAQAFR